ncbi:methyltransferase type 11 [Sphingomonas gilva]|uniref:Methyltransferase type 11 n=1 Tax=Sphingomonas gilva TaxID=2305907 RepID=A0A396RK73_9SPHN|nr:methyltransferase domain-containing protein [Sphingomonas gilva]RHW16624.1 methyltransferase type 11 [Sphingomonas gilva]
MRQPLFAAFTALALFAAPASAQNAAPAADPAIAQAVAAPTRTAANIARDRYRHPAETLAFYGVKPGQTVVELWPGGGWYTEILAPLVKDGTLYAAAPWERGLNGVKTLQAANPAVYGKIKLVAFPATEGAPAVPDGSADVVLTFRNVHNWRFGGVDAAQSNFDAVFKMLKPGGTFGVVDHRLPEGMDSALEEDSGYMKESSIIAFAEKAGFRLVGRSEINANPKDTHDHPEGVWTLPPSYRLKDVDRAKYQAVGESDRMTLKFEKPRG